MLDPAHTPGTGTPEAGGLSSRELLATLRSFAQLNLVGADIVEVAPAYDHAQITGIAAAHVGYEILSALAAGRPAPELTYFSMARTAAACSTPASGEAAAGTSVM